MDPRIEERLGKRNRKPGWLDVDQYMTHQKPNLDRSTFTRSNEWSFGVGGNVPKKKFDKRKCKTCGGGGRIFVQKEGSKARRKGTKTSVPCPDDCKHVVHY